MNKFDVEFWNGSLKSAILIRKEVEKLLDVCDDSEREGIKIALKRISEVKREIEDLNGNSIKRALKTAAED
ncbi:MAG: hypothetical protein M0Z77_11735 [Thermoplasmatales archaeon]|nr:hypothetical protein [Thermoplasmatales archaeon]